MCSNYPNCGHAGPLVDRRDDLGDRHCERGLPNHECPYLRAGCLGCTNATFRGTSGMITYNGIPLTTTPIDWARRKLPPLEITVRLDGVQDALNQIATNPLLLAHNRRAILRLVTAYLFNRSNDDA